MSKRVKLDAILKATTFQPNDKKKICTRSQKDESKDFKLEQLDSADDRSDLTKRSNRKAV